MLLSPLRSIFSWALLGFFLFVSHFLSAQVVETDYDCINVREISIPFVQPAVRSENTEEPFERTVIYYQDLDLFTFWYKFKIREDCTIRFSVLPTNKEDEYEFFLYRFTERNFCEALVDNTILPISRSSYMPNDFARGNYIAYQKELKVKAGQEYYLSVMNVNGPNCGHKLNLEACGDLFEFNSVRKPCFDFSYPKTPQEELISEQNAAKDDSLLIAQAETPETAIPEPEPLPEVGPEPEPILPVIPEPQPEPEPIPEPQPEPEPIPEPQPEPEPTPEPQPEPEPTPEPKPIVTPAVAVAKEDVRETKPDASGEQDPKNKTEANAVSETETPPQAEPKEREYPVDEFLTVKGFVFDNESGKPVEADLVFRDKVSGKITRVTSTEDKGYEVTLERGRRYNISCKSFGYYNVSGTVEYFKPTITDYYLLKVKPGDNFVMESIFFHPSTFAFKDRSYPQLDQLFSYLEKNPNVKIEIHGHTAGDNPVNWINDEYADRGPEWNFQGSAKKLSKLRAEAVKAYLVDKGISANRLECKGYGGSRMMIKNPKNQAERKRNMRVEVMVLSNDYNYDYKPTIPQ